MHVDNMTNDRRTNHAARAALLRLRLAEHRIVELPAFRRTLKGADAAAELSRAIDVVVALLRGDNPPDPAQAPWDDLYGSFHFLETL